MKKLIVLVCAVVFLFGVIGIVQAQSDWAKYKKNPVQECQLGGEDCIIAEDYAGPRKFIFDYAEENIEYYTLDCCFCHGPDAPGNRGGPQLPDKQCP